MTRAKAKTAADALIRMRGGGSWNDLSMSINKLTGVLFNKGYLNAVASGKRKPSNKLLIALGLPPNTIPVIPCTKCGKLHEFRKTCPKKRRTPKLKPWRHLIDLEPAQVAQLMRERKEYHPDVT